MPTTATGGRRYYEDSANCITIYDEIPANGLFRQHRSNSDDYTSCTTVDKAILLSLIQNNLEHRIHMETDLPVS
jgi:hypothetical protein